MAATNVVWKVVSMGSALMAARLTRSALDKAWSGARGGEPPRNPAAPGVAWKEAIVWSVASGTAMALSRMLATQGAATVWKKATGSLPPGVDTVGA